MLLILIGVVVVVLLVLCLAFRRELWLPSDDAQLFEDSPDVLALFRERSQAAVTARVHWVEPDAE